VPAARSATGMYQAKAHASPMARRVGEWPKKPMWRPVVRTSARAR